MVCRTDNRDRWTTITGAGDGDPAATAVARLRAETELSAEDLTVLRPGDPVGSVLPVLVEAETRPAVPDGCEWVPAPVLLERETVPWLWQAYDAVRPTVERVASDTEHGSSTLSVRALETLRDEAALAARAGAGPERVRPVARDLIAARPAMAVVSNRLNRALAAADGAEPTAVADAAHEGIEQAVEADSAAAANAAGRVEGMRVATLSRSGTVLAALADGAAEAVLVAASYPGGEGVGVAATLAAEATVTLATDAAFPAELAEWDADALLVGADTVFPDGRVRNKVGTYPAAAVATREGIPVFVAAATDKVSPEPTRQREPWPGDAPFEHEPSVPVSNPTFDVTPAACVDTLVTERGPVDTTAVAAIAAEHRERAAWDGS